MIEDIKFSHVSVLRDESVEGLNIDPNGIYVDGTAGAGGHSAVIAKRLLGGRVISIDRDEAAINAASARLAEFGERSVVVRDNFRNIADVCAGLGIEKINGLLLDLGVSSYQLDTAERGFSYNNDAPLDMRMDRRCLLTAYDVVNSYDENDLKKIIFDYGEERFAARIAAAIVETRSKEHIKTTAELAAIIKKAMPQSSKDGGHHPAKRTFQAIRIEVNKELDVIESTIRDAMKLLDKGGRIAIITFHSLEDRIVKQTFASLAAGCTCPPDFPICVCGNKPQAKIITKKPVLPSAKELDENPRARSAKLRVLEKL